MIQQLLTFNKGLSTKLDPHLIGRDEALICENIDINDGSIHPLKDFVFDQTTTGKYNTYFNSVLIANTDPTDERFYVEYAGRLYWSNSTFGTYGLMRYNGTSAGIEAAAPAAPTVAAGLTPITGGKNLNGVYSYTYTYVDTDGIESAPAPIATTASLSNQDITIDLSTGVGIDNLTGIVQRNVYRTGGSNPTFNLIAEGPIATTSYTDNTRDIDVARIELTTIDDYPPPSDLDMLIENLGTFWGSVGNKVYFSRSGSPEYWHPLDFVVLDGDCTGIGKFADSIYAFTESNAYRIDGYSRDTVVKTKLPYNEGCVNKHCIVNIDTYLIWSSKNGICLFNGAEVSVITKNKLTWESFDVVGERTFDSFDTQKWNSGNGFEISYAIGYKDKYFAVTATGILTIDLSEGLKVSTISLDGAESMLYDNVDNVLLVVAGTNIYGYALSNEFMVGSYKTGRIVDEGTTVTKHYRDVELDGSPLTVEVFVNGISIKTYTGRNKFKLPPGSFGRDIQFHVTTNEEIRSIKYEYSIKKA